MDMLKAMRKHSVWQSKIDVCGNSALEDSSSKDFPKPPNYTWPSCTKQTPAPMIRTKSNGVGSAKCSNSCLHRMPGYQNVFKCVLAFHALNLHLDWSKIIPFCQQSRPFQQENISITVGG